MRLLIVITILISGSAFAQENPWETKKTENPWGNYEAKVTEEEIEDQEKIDTTTKQDLNSKDMKYHIRNTAKNKYKSGADFGVGFATGLVFNVGGAFLDGIISIPDTKREKTATVETVNDSTYSELKIDQVEKEAKKAIKGKKLFSTLGGTIAGSMAQIALLTGILVFA